MPSAATTGPATPKRKRCRAWSASASVSRTSLEYELATGLILNIRYAPDRPVAAWCCPIPTSPSANARNSEVARKEAQLHVALDNMPGALAYTDDELNIVLCNNRFIEMYPVPRELFNPGDHIPTSCAIWPSTAITVRATSTRWSPAGSKAYAIPSGNPFEDRTPDGTGLRSQSPRACTGGTVTVITDITRLKLAEEDLARKEAELHVALDNMPGALVYTDEGLNIVVLQRRFLGDVSRAERAAQAGTALSRLSALSGRARILRRRRHRGSGRAPDRKPAKDPTGQGIRGSHARRKNLSSRAAGR